MKTQSLEKDDVTVAATVAPEDLTEGDDIAILNYVVEFATYHWHGYAFESNADLSQLVHIKYTNNDGLPLKVRAICLPYLLVESIDKTHRTIDVRLNQLVRVSKDYASAVRKELGKKS